MGDYFAFRTFVSSVLIRACYAMGVVLITLAGVVLLYRGASDMTDAAFSSTNGALTLLLGLATLTFGNLAWRIVCELWILFFRIYEAVRELKPGDGEALGRRVL